MKRAPLAISTLAILVILGWSCKDGITPPPTPATPGKSVLSVLTSAGVAGTLTVGDHEYDAGASVPYYFDVDAEHENLRVYLDSTLVPPTGSVTLDKDHALAAFADAKLTIDVAQTEIVAETKAVASSANPWQAFRKYQESVQARIADLGLDQAMQDMRKAEALAFDPVADAAALRAAMIEIGDSLHAGQPGAGGTGLASGTRADGPVTAIVYVNGIQTSELEAAATTTDFITPVVNLAGYTDRSRYPVDRFYNRSAKYLNNQDGIAATCLGIAANAIATSIESAAEKVPKCFGALLPLSGLLSDLLEARSQLIQRYLGTLPDSAKDDSKKLALTVEPLLLAGSRVVFVGHSQGNLMIDEALRVLASRNPGMNFGCVGVVGIAPPAIPRIPNGDLPATLIAKGRLSEDILLQAGLASGVPTVPNTVTDTWDKSPWLQDTRAMNAVRRAWYQISSGIEIHYVNESYLTKDGTAQQIITGLQQQVKRVESKCKIVTREVLSVDANIAGTTLGVAPSDADGQGSGAAPFTRSYSTGTSVAVTAPASVTGAPFDHWELDGSSAGASQPISVTMDGDHSLRAIYASLQSVSGKIKTSAGDPIAGATISFSGISSTATSKKDGSYAKSVAYDYSGTVTVSTSACGGFSPSSRSLSHVHDAVAGQDFTATCATRQLSLTSNIGSPELSVSPTDIGGESTGEVPFSRKFFTGTKVTVTAPSSTSSAPFAHWIQNGNAAGESRTIAVTMNADVALEAVYGGATATTNDATAIEATSFTLNGTANPAGVATEVWFEYGTSPSLTTYSSTTTESIGAGSASVAFDASVSGRTKCTTYYFRAVASNSVGTVRGEIRSVGTVGCVSTGNVSVTLNITGEAQPTGPFQLTLDAGSPAERSISIEKGVTATFQDVEHGTNQIHLSDMPSNCVVAGGTDRTVEVIIGEVTSVTYDVVCSAQPVRPSVTSNAASSVGSSSFTANGSINPNGSATDGWIEYGTSPSLSTFAPTTPRAVGSGTGATPFSETLTQANPCTTYYYRAAASNSAGTTRGSIVSLKTLGCTGSITVSNAVTGSNQPAGPFSVTLDALDASPTVKSITKNGSVTFTGVPAGSHELRFTGSGIGTGSNCTITGGFVQSVVVTAGETASASYQVVCSAPATAPSVTTTAASSVGSSSFTANGSINPDGSATDGWIEYGTSPSLSTFAPTTPRAVGSGTSAMPFSETLTQANPCTTYYYRAAASNSAGTTRGSIVSLKTLGCTGSITVSNAVTGSNQPAGPFSVTLDALDASPTVKSITKNGSVTFTGVPAGSHELRLTGTGIGAGSNCTITGGFVHDVTVTSGQTSAISYAVVCSTIDAPSVVTKPATSVSNSHFTVNATINPNGGETDGWFEYGTSPSLSPFAATQPRSAGSGTSAASFSEAMSGAAGCTTYYFRIAASNSGGTNRGSILSTTTSGCIGSITVTTSFTGTNQPGGPFSVTLDALSDAPVVKSISRNGSVTFSGLVPGSHELRLTGSGIGAGSRCSISGGFVKSVSVPNGSTTEIYSVTCS